MMRQGDINRTEVGNQERNTIIELSADNINDYVTATVLPELPAGSIVSGIDEVTENSYVNWVFSVKFQHAGSRERKLFMSVKAVTMLNDIQTCLGVLYALELKQGRWVFVNNVAPGTVPSVIFFDKPNSTLVLSDI